MICFGGYFKAIPDAVDETYDADEGVAASSDPSTRRTAKFCGRCVGSPTTC